MPRKKAPITDADQVKALLLWARRERIVVSQMTVGDVTVVVSDLALATAVVPPKSDEQQRQNLYERFGGELLAQATKEDDDTTTTYDDDEYDYDHEHKVLPNITTSR